MAPDRRSNLLLYENEDIERFSAYRKKGYRMHPIIFVNGSRVPEKLAAQARPNQSLLSFLREVMRLTGSKLGCAEGGCGACTVMISKKDVSTGNLKHFSVNACLMPVLATDGCHVTTVEGIGTLRDALHPVQRAMVDLHGSQCGFCTPGIIVSIYALLANNPSVPYLEEHLDGNLCRCTGYRPIWDAARSLCDDGELVRGPCGKTCRECPDRDTCEKDCNAQDKDKVEGSGSMCSSSSKDKMKEYKDTFLADKKWRATPNKMFPTELIDAGSAVSAELAKPLLVVDRTEFHAGGTWFKPTTLVELLDLLQECSDGSSTSYKIVIGNTEVGIETRFKHAIYQRLISPSETISELFGIETSSSNLIIGSCCSLSNIQHECGLLGEQTRLARTVTPIRDMLRWFASTQIRNVACLGGNLVTASPISDMNPVLASMNANLIICGLADDRASVTRRVVAVSDFFLKYRTVDLRPNEVVERIEVPILRPFFEYLRPFKQARRREDDISIVTSGMRIRVAVRDGKYIIEDADLAFGGMAPTTVVAAETAKVLVGSEFSVETFEQAMKAVVKELNLPEAVPGGQAGFRMSLCAGFLYKFFMSCVNDLRVDVETIKADPSKYPDVPSEIPAIPVVDVVEEGGACNFLTEAKPKYSGVQVFPKPKVAVGLEADLQPKVDSSANAKASAVGKPATHMSGPLHCTGEAIYTDDIPLPPGTLQAAFVLSSECGSVFKSVDIAPALQIPGVHGVYTYHDLIAIGGSNQLGAVAHDEVAFLPVGEKIRTVGQVLGIVVAETLESAELGARTVEVQYEEVTKEKPIVTIEDAIEAKSMYDLCTQKLSRGDITLLDRLAGTEDTNTDTKATPKVGDIVKVSGSFRSGAQEHFYLEPMSTLVVPSESDTNLTIYCSTQAPTHTQESCALATGTPASKVVVRVKRMGGGFGGKETRTVPGSVAASVAAKISCRPVRLTYARNVDMQITGTRHAFMSSYHASAQVTEDGVKLVSLDVKLYANAGCGLDLSVPVMARALFHVDGCYNFPNFRAEGMLCKTVQPPHTAFRGFGGPQGMAVAEHVMDHLAVACRVPGDHLRRCNIYMDGDTVPYGMVMGEEDSGKWNIPAMWDQLGTELNVPGRRAAIDDFNKKNKWIKRGLSMLPTKFGIAYTAKFMNQGGSLVHLYTDGTVLVSCGGTEMGQGLFTKICQVAAQAFGIPIDDVYINDSSTDKVANTIATAASSSTDMYGMATLDACRQILKRLEPFRKTLGPDTSLKEVATAAFFARVDLSAHGFFALSDTRCGFDFGKEKPADYPDDKPENSWKGHPFNYFTQGVACSEVEIDVLTGNHRTLRSDVLVDVGSSINPTIDIGQIEGAFIQGVGWSTIEEIIYADDDHTWIKPRGIIFTTGPGTYKIPAFNDVPEIFNVSLLEKASNPFAVHSSKAIGEPPFFLGTSVFYAIKDAVSAARKQNLGKEAYFEMRLPATSERIRMYCADSIAEIATATLLAGKERFDVYQPQGSY